MAENLDPQSEVANIPPQYPPRTLSTLEVLKWPVTCLLIAGFALLGYFGTLHYTQKAANHVTDRTVETVASVVKTAHALAKTMTSAEITEKFTASIPEMTADGVSLEVARSHARETFTKTDSRNTLWDMVYLGTTTTEIQVPVTYRYHVNLTGPWKLDISGQTCVVEAPGYQPTLPPAIHTQGMEKRSDRGWARLNEDEQMRDLERSITPTLERYAGDYRHRELVREECRLAVAEFVRTWLLKEDAWRSDRFHSIKVLFPDEVNHSPEEFAPTVRLREVKPLPQLGEKAIAEIETNTSLEVY